MVKIGKSLTVPLAAHQWEVGNSLNSRIREVMSIGVSMVKLRVLSIGLSDILFDSVNMAKARIRNYDL